MDLKKRGLGQYHIKRSSSRQKEHSNILHLDRSRWISIGGVFVIIALLSAGALVFNQSIKGNIAGQATGSSSTVVKDSVFSCSGIEGGVSNRGINIYTVGTVTYRQNADSPPRTLSDKCVSIASFGIGTEKVVLLDYSCPRNVDRTFRVMKSFINCNTERLGHVCKDGRCVPKD